MEEKEGKNNKNGTDASNDYSPKPISVTDNAETKFILVSMWKLTNQLRWGKKGLLQQLWVSEAGESEWRNVPEEPPKLNDSFGHLKRVKLNPECYKRHYPPHRPWYVMPKYDSLNPGMADLEWIVEEYPENEQSYWAVGFMCGDVLVEIRKHHYWIEKKDCI